MEDRIMSNITKRNPSTDLTDWLLNPWANFSPSSEMSNMWRPSVDLQETDNSYLVTADISGVDAKDIEVNIENNTLTLSGQREEEHKEEKATYTKRERFSGKFYRTFKLPLSVDVDNIKAKSENGVLKIILPKQESSKPKRIQIE
jgi:HSP20 family protein